MKRPVAIAVFGCLLTLGALSLACSDEPTATMRTIALVHGLKDEPFYVRLEQGAQAKADALGVRLIHRPPARFDLAVQTQIVDELIALKVSALVISPVDRLGMIEPLRRAHAAGIVVVTVDQFIGDNTYGMGGPADFPIAYVGSDNREGGHLACAQLAAAITNKGKVYIQGTKLGISATINREEGCQEELAKFPGIAVLPVQYSDLSEEMAKAQTLGVLDAHPDVNGIFGSNVGSSVGAGKAVAQRGLGTQIQVVSYDSPSSSVRLLKDNVVDMLIGQKPAEMGSLGVDIAVKALDGVTGQVPKVHTGFVIVTRANVDDPSVVPFIY
jgi:ribose transport system substrate-binding protein